MPYTSPAPPGFPLSAPYTLLLKKIKKTVKTLEITLEYCYFSIGSSTQNNSNILQNKGFKINQKDTQIKTWIESIKDLVK